MANGSIFLSNFEYFRGWSSLHPQILTFPFTGSYCSNIMTSIFSLFKRFLIFNWSQMSALSMIR